VTDAGIVEQDDGPELGDVVEKQRVRNVHGRTEVGEEDNRISLLRTKDPIRNLVAIDVDISGRRELS
jgi:hypothetical protein